MLNEYAAVRIAAPAPLPHTYANQKTTKPIAKLSQPINNPITNSLFLHEKKNKFVHTQTDCCVIQMI